MSGSFLRSAPRLFSAAGLLTPRRLRAQAVVLAFCLWGVGIADFATPGLTDRAGNVKFQDFLPLYVSARIIARGGTDQLYDERTISAEEAQIIHQSANLRLPNLYGPQVSLFFVPLSRFRFLAAALLWSGLSVLIYGGSIHLVLRTCPSLLRYSQIVAVAALAFPPLFHFLLRGQLSALALACFTAAVLAFRGNQHWLAGIALGLLVSKPQFLVAVPLVLLLAGSWRPLAGLTASAGAQLAIAWIYFGSAVMRSYLALLWHVSTWIGTVELSLAPIQMHSLRSFWSLLIRWPEVALVLYAISSIAVIAIAAAVWKSSSLLAVRFSALTLAAILVNPHLFIYDLLVLAPVLLLLADWAASTVSNPSSSWLPLLLYAVFVLPLLGPLSRWTHIQLSVPFFVALLWWLWRQSATARATTGHKLASPDSGVV